MGKEPAALTNHSHFWTSFSEIKTEGNCIKIFDLSGTVFNLHIE